MDILNKSTLTVVVVTAIASGVILLTGNIVADNKNQSESNENTIPTSDKVAANKQHKKVVNKALSAVSSSMTTLAPPPGPFLNNQQDLSAPVAPRQPINNSIQPSQLAKPFNLTKLPQPPVGVKFNNPSLVAKPLEPKNINQSSPTLSKKMGSEPLARQTPTLNSAPKSKSASMPSAPVNMMKQPRMNSENQPIWMQRGNIVQKGMDSSKGMPQRNGQNQNHMGMPNMGWNNYPPQQYMYIPVPMMPVNGMPPQMPMFNKNTNPPSNSWLPTPSNNKPVIQEKIAPVQKETK